RRRRGLARAHERASGRLPEHLLRFRVALETRLQQIVGEREHAAAGVMNQHEFFRIEQVMGDNEVANLDLVAHAAGIANDVRVSGLKAEQILDVDTGVHASDYRKTLCRLYSLLAGMLRFVHGFARRIALVVLQVLVDDARHGALPLTDFYQTQRTLRPYPSPDEIGRSIFLGTPTPHRAGHGLQHSLNP